MGAAIRGLIISEPDLAISAFEAISPDRRKLYTNEFAAGLVRSVGLDNAETLINGMIARSSSSGNVGSAGYDIIFKDFALIKIQTAYAKGNIEEAIHWLTPQLGKSHVDQSLVVAAVERYARVEPEKAAAWLEGVNDARSATQQGTIGYRALLSTWTQKAGQPAVGEWLKTQTGRPHYDRLALEFSSLLAAQNPAEAARWAGTIKDSTVRANAMARLQPQTK